MWKIIGHHQPVEMLSGLFAAGRLPHSLLITGPAGVGKRTLALELAKAINCTGDDPPCQNCVHCRQIAAGAHPDVVTIERPDGKDSILIQQVRELRDAASLRPFQARQKIYVVAGAESLTLQAADALLKTLEEPQPQLSLILTAADDEALPATIVSRCRVLPLHPVETGEIVHALEERGAVSADAVRIARFARGSVGWALRAHQQPKLLAEQEQMVDNLTRLLDLDAEARLQLAETLTADRKDRSSVRRQIEVLTFLARDLLLVHHDLPPLLVSDRAREPLKAQAERLGLVGIAAYLRRLRLTMERIDQNVDPRLALEALFLSLP